jgi:hypothetical protein
MDDGISDEGGFGNSDKFNQEMNRSDYDSEALYSTSRSRRGGPRVDEHGKRKAGNKSAGEKLRSGVLVLGGQASYFLVLQG